MGRGQQSGLGTEVAFGEPCPPPPEDANSAGTFPKEPTPRDRATPAPSAAARGTAAEPGERGSLVGEVTKVRWRRVGRLWARHWGPERKPGKELG